MPSFEFQNPFGMHASREFEPNRPSRSHPVYPRIQISNAVRFYKSYIPQPNTKSDQTLVRLISWLANLVPETQKLKWRKAYGENENSSL